MRFNDADMRDVWTEYKMTGSSTLRARLILKYMPLVRHIAERLLSGLPRFVDGDDLVSAGTIGLMDAVEAFDLSRSGGAGFKTFCVFRIRGNILDELRSLDWVPRLVRSWARKINRARADLRGELCREPLDHEVAARLGLTLIEFHALAQRNRAVFVEPLHDDRGSADGKEHDINVNQDLALAECSREADPVEVTCRSDLWNYIRLHLTKKEQTILFLYYRDDLTMKEIAKVLRLTESRVCQIHADVLERLRERLERMRCDLSV